MSAPPCTEIALIRLMADAKIEDPSTEAGKIWANTVNTASGVAGYQRSCWSRQLEDSNLLMWLIDWDSVAHHQAFVSSEEYKLFVGHAAPIFDLSSPPIVYHVNFFTHPPQALSVGPVTEIVTFMLPLDLSPSDASTFEARAKKCIEVFMRAQGGPNSIDGGWVAEGELENPAAKGTKAKPFTFALGWDSVEHHMEFRKAEAFAEGLGPVKEKAIGSWMGHAKLQPA